jgi:hypothetical protein
MCLAVAAITYVPATTGGLYGRDTHGATDIAHLLLHQKWQHISEAVVFGDLTTPFLHYNAAIIHRITALGLYPTESINPTIPRILPILFLGTTFLFLYRLFETTTERKTSFPLLIPLILWFPLLEFYTTFRRAPLGLLLIVCLVFASYRGLLYRNRGRGGTLFLIISVGVLLSHRAGAYYAFLFLIAMVVAGSVPSSNIRHTMGRLSGPKLVLFTIIWISVFYVMRDALEGLVMLPVLAVTKLSASAGQHTINIGTAGGSPRGFVELLPTYALFGIVGILAATYFLHIVAEWRQKGVEAMSIGVFFYSGLLGGLAAFAYLFPSPIEHVRILTVFALSAAWFPLAKLSDYHTRGYNPARVAVAFLLILTVFSTLPMFLSTSGFSHQIDDAQRFEEDDYAVTAFLNDYSNDQQIVGDANLAEVVSPRTDARVIGAPHAIVNASVPENSLVVLAERNKNEYLTTYHRSWVSLNPPHLVDRYEKHHSKIYSSGGNWVWVNVTN